MRVWWCHHCKCFLRSLIWRFLLWRVSYSIYLLKNIHLFWFLAQFDFSWEISKLQNNVFLSFSTLFKKMQFLHLTITRFIYCIIEYVTLNCIPSSFLIAFLSLKEWSLILFTHFHLLWSFHCLYQQCLCYFHIWIILLSLLYQYRIVILLEWRRYL
jgi:hypothetical protein